MRRTLILATVLLLLVFPLLSQETAREARSKTIGKYLLAAGCAVFVSSMVLMFNDQETGYGYYQGMEVALFSIGAILFTNQRQSLRVNASVRKKAASVQLAFSF